MSPALSNLGATILSGHNPPQYGRLGKGPVPASFQAAFDAGVSIDSVEIYINCIFNKTSATSQLLQVDGRLQPLLHATAASQS